MISSNLINDASFQAKIVASINQLSASGHKLSPATSAGLVRLSSGTPITRVLLGSSIDDRIAVLYMTVIVLIAISGDRAKADDIIEAFTKDIVSSFPSNREIVPGKLITANESLLASVNAASQPAAMIAPWLAVIDVNSNATLDDFIIMFMAIISANNG